MVYCAVNIKLALIEYHGSCTCISLWLGRGDYESRTSIVDFHLVMLGRSFRDETDGESKRLWYGFSLIGGLRSSQACDGS